MKHIKWIILAIIGILLLMSLYTVDEINQVVVLQFGKPVRVVQEPGLHMKLPPPFQEALKFEDRLLQYDVSPSEVITRDKKSLIIDNYANWKIVEPLVFLQTVRTEAAAQARLDELIYSELREQMGKHDLNEIVTDARENIMRTVADAANRKSHEYGIEVIDVRIKRADLPEENEMAVFNRMRAERKRQANRYRSEGEEQSTIIRSQTDREKTVILAEARRIAEQIRGEGDAEAIRIYADAFGQSPQFFEFTRTLDAYKKAIDDSTVIFLSPNSDFLKYIKGARP